MTSARFRPYHRITSPADFRRAYERRQSSADALLIVYGVENQLEHARLGISVSRKRVRSAVARNRIKRVLREAFRLSQAELPTGIDLVVVPRGPRPLTYADARGSLPRLAQAVARRLNLRAEKPAT